MNDEYSELNDIILNRHDKSDTRKKMLIGIGTLAIVAIVIVIIMGRLSGSAPAQLPQAAMPPEPSPAFSTAAESVTATATPSEASSVLETQPAADESVQDMNEDIMQQPVPLEQSEVVVVDETAAEAPKAAEPAPQPQHSVVSSTPAPAKVVAAPVPAPKVHHPAGGQIYIQVGSFTQYKPSKAFLASIDRNGYQYTFQRVVMKGQIVNKVLVGPFKDRNDAVAHLSDVRRKIESGAFIYTVKP